MYIYALTDPRTNKIRYIGKTYDINKRYQSHLLNSSLKNKTYKNYWIKSLLKVGLVPEIKILAKCKDINSDVMEKRYISKYKKLGKLTNGTLGGDGISKGTKMPNTLKRQIANKKRCISIDIINKKTMKRRNFVSIKAAAKFIGVDSVRISQCLNQKKNSLSTKGYYITLKNQELKIRETQIPNKPKSVIGIDTNSDKIYFYDSAYKAKKDGFSGKAVSAVCRNEKNRKHYLGVVWFYA